MIEWWSASVSPANAAGTAAFRLGLHAFVMLDLRQHVLAKAPHIVDYRVGGGSVETEIDCADAEIAQGAQIGRDRRAVAGTEPPVAVVGALRDRLAVLAEAVGDADRRGIAPGVAGHRFEPLDPRFEPLQRVEPVPGVRADRIPRVAEPRGAPHRRAALAA